MQATSPFTEPATRPRATSPLLDSARSPAEVRAAKRAGLRELHLQCGVDPRYLEVPHGQSLWFVHTTIDRQVHAGCLGFTRHLMDYALGADAAQANSAVARYLAAVAPEVSVMRAEARRAAVDHPEELTFPEQVRRVDMPARMVRTREAS